ncbi:MAG: hypothetical protein M3R13_07625 [Armatimonadota bacterium]|nr:hypothetical protein [Armatimonadota bacterium]
MTSLIPIFVLVAAALAIAILLVLWGWSSANRPLPWRIVAFALGCLLLLGVSMAPYPLYPIFQQARAGLTESRVSLTYATCSAH